MILHVVKAEYLHDLQLRLEFNDGYTGIVDLAGELTGPVFQPLNDPEYFRKFELAGHTLNWPNGADFAPEYLRDLSAKSNTKLHTVR